MNIKFELNKKHKDILSTIYIADIDRWDDFGLAFSLIQCTEGDYLKLLRKVLKDGVYRKPQLYGLWRIEWLGKLEASSADLEKSLKQLELLDLLRSEEIKVKGESYTKICLTGEGVRLAKAIVDGRRPVLRPPAAERSTVFVASAFGHDQLDALFESEIKPACLQVGLQPFRIDMSEPDQTISARMVEGIVESKCLIADLTFARPSVYFEVGMAHGFGVPMLLTCREDHYRNNDDSLRVHFDLEQYKISYWRLSAQGRFLWQKGMSPGERINYIVKKG